MGRILSLKCAGVKGEGRNKQRRKSEEISLRVYLQVFLTPALFLAAYTFYACPLVTCVM